jgi:hypothetical protein
MGVNILEDERNRYSKICSLMCLMSCILQGFMTDCPDGRMNKEKMKEMFNAVAPSVSFTQKN